MPVRVRVHVFERMYVSLYDCVTVSIRVRILRVCPRACAHVQTFVCTFDLRACSCFIAVAACACVGRL